MLLKVEQKAKRVMELINQFFTLAKLEAGDMELEISRINICEVCRENILDFYELLKQKEFQVEVKIPEEAVFIMGNKEALHRILYNLISNVIRYGLDGRYLGLVLRSVKNDVYIDVIDKGKGIEKEFAGNVFERLFTMEDSRNRRIQGNGLGQCSLIGGETAEMPGMYKEGDYDIAGFAVGIVDKDKIINGKDIKSGDKLIGIASSGVHSNGYSLIRKVFKNLDEDFNGKAIWEELLTPTKIYVKPVLSLLEKFNIKGMAHVTGGGFYENLPRMLSKEGLSIVINKNSYEIPEIFKKLMELGVKEEEMYNTFNMGIGFVLCVEEDEVEEVLKELSKQGEKAFEIGYINAGGEGVCIK